MAINKKNFSQREAGLFTPINPDGAPLYDENGEQVERIDYGTGLNYVARTTIGDTDYFELPNGYFVKITDAVTITTGAAVDGIFRAGDHAVNIVDGAGNPTGDTLAAGDTRKVNYVQSIGDERYYAINTGRFVKVADGSFSTESTVNPPSPIVAAGEVRYIPGFGIHVWTLAHEHVKNTMGNDMVLKHGTRVRIEAKAQIGDSTYFKVGPDKWIDSAYVEILH